MGNERTTEEENSLTAEEVRTNLRFKAGFTLQNLLDDVPAGATCEVLRS